MRIDFFGPDNSYFDAAFFGAAGYATTIIGTASATRVVFQQPQTGALTTLTGSGFTFDALGNPTAGTITGAQFSQGGAVVANFSNMSWDLVALDSALQTAAVGDNTGLEALFNADPITLDASGSSVALTDASNLVLTTPITLIGSGFADTLKGSNGNDIIHFGNGDNAFARDSGGDDRYVYTNVTTSYSSLVFASTLGGITAVIDGVANTGTITKANGVDTLVDIANPLKAGWVTGGFGLYGTKLNDVFTLNGGAETWMQVAGGDGSDVFNLTLTGWIRLNFNWNSFTTATQALNINVQNGVVLNDGYGFSDTLNITQGAGVLQIRGTDFNDTLIGSNGREDFILEQGNDTVDGGGGRDRLNYDRLGVTAVNVDLAAGTATGLWDGIAFSDVFSNIEDVKGSKDTNDILKGDANANRLQGRAGDDELTGRGGKDTLEGGDGNDTLLGGGGNDELSDGAGNDIVDGGRGNDTLLNGGGTDQFIGGGGDDTLVDDSTAWTAAKGVVEMNLKTGIHGTLGSVVGQDSVKGIENYTFIGDWDTLVTGNNARNIFVTDKGNDTVVGNGGNDKISTGAGNDVLNGGKGRDALFGGGGKDKIKGGGGADTLEGGKGNDRMTGGSGNDIFVFNDAVKQGRDVITDFTDGSDMLRIAGGAGTGFAGLTLSASGADTKILLEGGTTIILKAVDISLVDAGDFDFI